MCNSYSRKARRPTGSMLILTMLTMTIVVLTVAVLSSFLFMVLLHEQLKNRAENVSLRAAHCLNAYDRAGRINNMTAASRELVFNSRSIYIQTAADALEFEPLAQLHMEQSRQGAQLICDERDRILSATLAELKELAKNVNSSSETELTNLPGFKTKAFSVIDFELGYAKDLESNVAIPSSNNELLEYDRQNEYFDPQTNLYYGNVRLKLDGPDSDLNFKLSPIPAPVLGTTAPTRLDNGDRFISTLSLIKHKQINIASCEYLPAAVRLKVSENFESVFGTKYGQTICACATSTTNGASQTPAD